MLRGRWLLLLGWMASTFVAYGQITLEADPFASSFIAENITALELKEALTDISSDLFEGRETGSPGQEKAALYIADRLHEMGLERAGALQNYYQHMTFTWVKWESLDISLNGRDYKHLQDFLCFQEESHNSPNMKVNDVVYLGYGIDDPAYSDYAKARVRGKVVMIYMGEPRDEDGKSYLTGRADTSAWSTDIQLKLDAAAKNKVRAVLIVDPNLRNHISANRSKVMRQSLSFGKSKAHRTPNSLYISIDLAKQIIGEKEKSFKKNQNKLLQTGAGRPLHLPVEMVINQHLSKNALYSKNIIALLPGIDPVLRDEVVVVSAHYDHLGTRGDDIYNGADDNGSGTVAVMEIMETLAEARDQGMGPKRSVMCVFFTAEEKGLLGSKYYATDPVIPFDQTVVDVNIDMIGRVDPPHETDDHYIYVIGSDRLSTDLHKINEATNETFSSLSLDYKYNAKDDPNRIYYRSDHYNFAKNGVPSIFYFSGVHADYHKPTDTVDKIEFKKYTAVTKHIFHTIWELANRQKRIVVDVTDDTSYDR